MELKSLFLGILFSVGIFGIKAGAGLHYRLSLENRPGVRWGVYLGFAGLYGALFAGIGLALSRLHDRDRNFSGLYPDDFLHLPSSGHVQ